LLNELNTGPYLVLL